MNERLTTLHTQNERKTDNITTENEWKTDNITNRE